MARGQRFELDLDSDSDSASPAAPRTAETTSLSFNLVKDIAEKDPDSAPPPAPPTLKSSAGGFPAHTSHPASRFKQRQQTQARPQPPAKAAPPRPRDAGPPPSALQPARGPLPSLGGTDPASRAERLRIDAENKRTLADMGDAQIAAERAELLGGGVPGLTQSLIERLMKRADVAAGSEEMGGRDEEDEGRAKQEEGAQEKEERRSKRVAFAEEEPASTPEPASTLESASQPDSAPIHEPRRRRHDPDAAPRVPPADLHPASSPDTAPPAGPPVVHFPAPPQPYAELDPSSASFLADLQDKYFPDLPHDPSALAWMRDPSPPASPTSSSLFDTDAIPSAAETAAAADYTYSPAATSLAPSALRFDFRGRLIPPSAAAALPAHRGLHHHAHAPAAAGYTVGELAILQRSTVAAQRTAAHQTLGRILYRLGRGGFGPRGSDVYEGLWRVVARERVLDVLAAEAARGGDSGSRSAWAVATEAVWLWQKGGGKTGKEEDATR